MNLSRELKNGGRVSQTLAWQGDAAYYRGDWKSARALYEQALQAGTQSKEPDKVLIAKFNLARLSIQEGRARDAINSLRALIKQAQDLGLPHVALDGSLSLAEAMMKVHDSAHAQQELEGALLRADKLGLKTLSTRARYLLAAVARAGGNQAEAQQHYRAALQLLDEMRKDPGAEQILRRGDFKAINEEANRSAKDRS